MKLDYGTWMSWFAHIRDYSGLSELMRRASIGRSMSDVLTPTSIRGEICTENPKRRKIARGVGKWQASRRYESVSGLARSRNGTLNVG